MEAGVMFVHPSADAVSLPAGLATRPARFTARLKANLLAGQGRARAGEAGDPAGNCLSTFDAAVALQNQVNSALN
jgi:hypothetical protein